MLYDAPDHVLRLAYHAVLALILQKRTNAESNEEEVSNRMKRRVEGAGLGQGQHMPFRCQSLEMCVCNTGENFTLRSS